MPDFSLDSLDLSKLGPEEIIAGAKAIVEHANERILFAQEEKENALQIVSMLVRKAGGVVILSDEDQGLPNGQLMVKGDKATGKVVLTYAIKLELPPTAEVRPAETPDATGGCGCTEEARCDTHTPKLVVDAPTA